ncbi:DUF998 domain-containing protein [Streptomyces sp. NPDC055078]
MTPTLSAPITTATTTGAGRRTRVLLAGGIAAGPLFLVVGVVQGLTRDGFDFTRNAISQLSLGGLGWIQITSFLLTGALAFAGAVGVRRALRDGPGGVWAPRLIGVFGASFLVAGVFTADAGDGFPAGTPDGPPATMTAHGTIHLAGATVGFLALCAAFFVLARHFAGQDRRGWALACRLVPVGVMAGSATSSLSVLAFTCGAALGLIGLSAVAARLATGVPLAQR